MKARYSMVLPLILFLSPLWSQTVFQTVYTEEKYYITKGSIRVQGDTERIRAVLTDIDDYSRWAFRGLTREDPSAENLPAFLVDTSYNRSEEGIDLLEITFDLNRFLKKRGLKTYFTVHWTENQESQLDSLVFDYYGSKRYLKNANYTFLLTPVSDEVQIDIICKVRLSSVMDLFYSERLYDRNVTYYIKGITDNLRDVLNQF